MGSHIKLTEPQKTIPIFIFIHCDASNYAAITRTNGRNVPQTAQMRQSHQQQFHM